MEHTEYPDGESLQSFLTYEVHCVLTKLDHLSNSRPVLDAALLENIAAINFFLHKRESAYSGAMLSAFIEECKFSYGLAICK